MSATLKTTPRKRTDSPPAHRTRRERHGDEHAVELPHTEIAAEEDRCPVIRANQVFFAGGSGKLHVVFY